MDILYREARAEDLPACLAVFEESVEDLHRRHNMPGSSQPAPWRLEVHRHILATGIYQVGELDGRVAGFTCAFVRGRIWFLAGFWVRPDLQKQHIGAPLLRRAMDAGRQMGASIFFVWASVDLPAMAAYMKHGMLPGSQILVFEGKPQLENEPAGYEPAPDDHSFIHQMDADVLEMQRETDHDRMQGIGWRPSLVRRSGQPVGYYYVHEDGAVGPAAWTESLHAEAVLTLACRQSAAHIGVVKLMVPGMNHEGVRFALRSGLKLTGYSHLLTSAPFGNLDRYLPSGPQFF